MTTDRAYKAFIDFDGTITRRDLGEHLFYDFGDVERAKELVRRINEKTLVGTASWRALLDTLRDDATLDKLATRAEDYEIDPTFPAFVEFLRERGVEFFVLSDGFEFYIRRVLEKAGITDATIIANDLVERDGDLVPLFPHQDEECAECANCKRNHIIENSADEEFTIYVGNGVSDQCAAPYCDFIFAKDSLLNYCERERITYFPYASFDDVRRRLEGIFAKKRLKKKHRAHMLRRQTYMRG